MSITVIEPNALLVLPHLRVSNVNTISGPLTWGFPPISSFVDFQQDIGRCLTSGFGATLGGIGIISHVFEANVSRPAKGRYRVLKASQCKSDGDGNPEGAVEEGRANLEVSLILGVSNLGTTGRRDLAQFAQSAWDVATSLQLAGGRVHLLNSSHSGDPKPELVPWPKDCRQAQMVSRRIGLELLPGYALVSREAELDRRLRELRKLRPDGDGLDVLLDCASRRVEPLATPPTRIPGDSGRTGNVEWRARRRPERLVPIPVGYAAISPLLPAEEAVDGPHQAPCRFVENLFTLGQWLSPHRVQDLRHLLWQPSIDADEEVYRFSTPFYATDPIF